MIFPLLALLLPLIHAQSTTETAPAIVASNYIIASNPDVTPVNLKITTQDPSRQNDTAPNLYGLIFEDISHSGDGGIYAELLINRAFQGMLTCSLLVTGRMSMSQEFSQGGYRQPGRSQ